MGLVGKRNNSISNYIGIFMIKQSLESIQETFFSNDIMIIGVELCYSQCSSFRDKRILIDQSLESDTQFKPCATARINQAILFQRKYWTCFEWLRSE
jgi:hypothetical protein